VEAVRTTATDNRRDGVVFWTRNTWRRELEKDIKRTGHTWKQLERIAQDRGDWRVVIGGLCSGRSKGPK